MTDLDKYLYVDDIVFTARSVVYFCRKLSREDSKYNTMTDKAGNIYNQLKSIKASAYKRIDEVLAQGGSVEPLRHLPPSNRPDGFIASPRGDNHPLFNMGSIGGMLINFLSFQNLTADERSAATIAYDDWVTVLAEIYEFVIRNQNDKAAA